jgi:hypothetical protein
MRIQTLFVALTAMTALLAADVSGPVLGYARRGDTLRPILGIPGASYFGTAIETGELAITAVSSAGEYAIAFTPDYSRMQIVAVSSRRPAQPFVLLSDASAVRSVVLSASGTSLAVVRDNNEIDIFTGLPSTPRKDRTLSLSALPAIVAVSDDGGAVTAGDRTLLSIYEGDETRQIGAINLRYAGFRPGSRDFAYIDGDLVIAVSGATTRVVAASPDGVSDARSVVPSRDGRAVFILNAGAKELLIARDEASSQRFDLPCTASDLEWLGVSDLRFSCASSGRVHLIDVSERGPRIFFVPEPVQ